MGPRAAQALLPQVQLRASGGRDRGQHRAVADDGAQLRPRRRARATCIPSSVARRADPGAARCADVRRALALGRGRRARAAAVPRRQEGAAADRAHGRRGPDRRRCFPTRSPAPRTSSASARFPTIRWCARPSATASTRRWTSTAWSGCSRRLESGAIRVVTRDLTEPSPLALEVLSARPYAYLDDAPLEERRTQAVMGRRWLGAGSRVRPRPARPRGDRARADGSLARCPPTPTSCTMRWPGSAL